MAEWLDLKSGGRGFKSRSQAILTTKLQLFLYCLFSNREGLGMSL